MKLALTIKIANSREEKRWGSACIDEIKEDITAKKYLDIQVVKRGTLMDQTEGALV